MLVVSEAKGQKSRTLALERASGQMVSGTRASESHSKTGNKHGEGGVRSILQPPFHENEPESHKSCIALVPSKVSIFNDLIALL